MENSLEFMKRAEVVRLLIDECKSLNRDNQVS